MKKYYCLVAGAPDVTLDGGKLTLSVADFKSDYLPEISSKDQELIHLFYLKFDNRNLLDLLADNEKERLDTRALYSRQDLLDAMDMVAKGDEQGRILPAYMYDFISSYPSLKETTTLLPEDVLTALYYRYAANCTNKFVRSWFEFSLNVNNILVALTARRFGFSASDYLVGRSDVTAALRTSGARDFGLSAELDYVDELIRISEVTDPVEKERKLDVLKWNWLEEVSFFHYFTVERLFTLVLRLDMLERWSVIDKEKGGEVFRQLIRNLKDDVEVPAEFKK